MQRRPNEHSGHDHDAGTGAQHAGARALQGEHVAATSRRNAAGATLSEISAERAQELTVCEVIVEPTGDVRAGSKANDVQDKYEDRGCRRAHPRADEIVHNPERRPRYT